VEIPKISFTIKSLGGIELSTVPYAFHWVNSSIHWILEQVLVVVMMLMLMMIDDEDVDDD